MKKKLDGRGELVSRLKKLWLMMRLSFLLILFTVVSVSASVYSQNSRLTLKMNNSRIADVFNAIEEQSDYYFFYNRDQFDDNRLVEVNFQNRKINEVLDELFKGESIAYEIVDRNILIKVIDSFLIDSKQQKDVSGKVTDSSGAPLPGVSIVIKGTTKGVITDFDGNFSFENVPGEATLVFSFVGMKSQEIAVAGKSDFTVVMEDDAIGIEEVVAIGYGTTTKRKSVGAITSINAEALEQTPYSNTSQALQGQVPGVIVHGSGGAPGDVPSISIRGGETPLFVIDGVVQDEYAFSVLNPDDIETITFLKDAASTAIYGSRAGDGIVLVKTKRGVNNKLQLRYSANYQLSQPTMMPELMDATEWALMHNDAARFDEIDPIFSDEQLRIIANGEDPIAYANTDWQEETLKAFAEQQRHNFSLTGGDTKTNYFVSLGYLNNNGIFKANSMSLERFNMRSNVTTSFDKIGLDVSLNLDGSVQNLREPSAGEGRLFREINFMTSPHQPVRNPDGTYAAGAGNPAARADKNSGYDKERRKIINTQLDLRWKVPGVEGLVAGVMGAYKDGDGFDKRWALTVPLYEPNGTVAPSLAPSLQQTMFYSTTIDFESSLAYSNTFGKHGIDATVVYTQRTGYYEEMEGSRLNFESSAVDMLFAGPSEGQDNAGLARESALAGVVGRVQYDYDQKYIIQLSGRYDGNDNFAPGKKWGFFPAIATGWVISSEPFMQDISDRIQLNNLKFRLSYGETGIVAGVNRFGYLATYNLESNVINIGNKLCNGFSEGNLVSPSELSWYSRNSTNIGVDFAFAENSLEGSFDYFYYKTTGYLVSPENKYSTPLGKSLPQIKSDSEHRRAGLETSLRYKKKLNNIYFSVGGNFTYYDQLWAKKASEDMASLKNPYVRETQEKDFFRSVYLADGYYQSADEVLNTPRPTSASAIQMGDLKYIDANGDGKIDNDDRRRVGKPDSPHFTYGVDFKVDYKGWSLSGLVQGTGNRYVDNGFSNEIPKDRLVEFTLDYWDSDNLNARFPRISTNWDNPNGLASTHSIMNAKYIRLKNLQLAYDLKRSLLRNMKEIAGFKLFVTGTNLLTSSDVMDLFDPESWMPAANASGGGVRAGASYPVQRTYTFGLNVEF